MPPDEKPDLRSSADEWTAYMERLFSGLTARAAELAPMAERFKAGYPLAAPAMRDGTPLGLEKWNDDIQKRAGDMRAQFAALEKQAGSLHDLEKAPVLLAGKIITGFKNQFLAPVEATIKLIRDRQTIYAKHLEAETRRAAQAEADQRRKEADAAAAEAVRTLQPQAFETAAEAFAVADEAQATASASSADLTRVHGTMSVTSLRTTWKFVESESDLMALVKAVAAGKAPLSYLQFNTTRIGVAVRSEKVRSVPGCVIREEKSV